MIASHTFDSLPELATHLRERLEQKKYVLLFAFNAPSPIFQCDVQRAGQGR